MYGRKCGILVMVIFILFNVGKGDKGGIFLVENDIYLNENGIVLYFEKLNVVSSMFYFFLWFWSGVNSSIFNFLYFIFGISGIDYIIDKKFKYWLGKLRL